MLLNTFAAAPATDRILRETEAKIMATFWAPRPYSAEQEARAHISLAKSALKAARDAAHSHKARVLHQLLAAKRRRDAAALLAQVPALQKAA